QLSEKMGLQPAYDLREITWKKGTSAAEGNLEPQPGLGYAELKKFRINAPDGNIYQTEGYRLPTRAEMLYVQKGMVDIPVRELRDYGWFSGNSNGTTQPVGSALESFRVDGYEFDDVAGNIMVWLNDTWTDLPLSGIDPGKNDRPDFSWTCRV